MNVKNNTAKYTFGNMTPDFRITQTLHCSFSRRPFDQFRQALCCCNKIKQTNKKKINSVA